MARVVTMLLLLMLAAVVPAAAQEPKKLDPVIVTGTKIETPAEQVGATVTVIDGDEIETRLYPCLLYTSPSPRDLSTSRMPSSA